VVRLAFDGSNDRDRSRPHRSCGGPARTTIGLDPLSVSRAYYRGSRIWSANAATHATDSPDPTIRCSCVPLSVRDDRHAADLDHRLGVKELGHSHCRPRRVGLRQELRCDREQHGDLATQPDV